MLEVSLSLCLFPSVSLSPSLLLCISPQFLPSVSSPLSLHLHLSSLFSLSNCCPLSLSFHFSYVSLLCLLLSASLPFCPLSLPLCLFSSTSSAFFLFPSVSSSLSLPLCLFLSVSFPLSLPLCLFPSVSEYEKYNHILTYSIVHLTQDPLLFPS